MKLFDLAGCEDFHFMPVVWEFLAAIETYHIYPRGQFGPGFWTLRAGGKGKTVMVMRAPKEQIQDHLQEPL